MRRLGRLAAGLAATTVLSLTAGGCVTVHGERAVVPGATVSEADQAVAAFLAAYNKADEAYDPALDADHVTGPLGAVTQAGLKARGSYHPDGNPDHRPLELTDATYLVPKKAGWPRWFLADTDSNRDTDGGDRDTRWLFVFVKSGPEDGWRAAYLAPLPAAKVPQFARDADGLAVPVTANAPELAVKPKELSTSYTEYLEHGAPDVFAPGATTSVWRKAREAAVRPGFSYQYADQPLDSGAFAPLGLRTKDGGALVFFSSKHFERQTAAEGLKPAVGRDTAALMEGAVTTTLTKERIASQLAYVPGRDGGDAGDGKVVMLNRTPGLVSAEGS
ncbi:hypothetical protein [uncultured Streptomyces sp.]|uniref:hypothetical protein n=1 Tax=uncultured Streptomyces sp. TaxID=174707 RepID=UPI002634EA61|nr:hypothetical protein [uncultured Streptomyces sp.]